MTNLIDKNGKLYRASKSDKRFLSGEIFEVSTDMILCVNKEKEKYYVYEDDQRLKNKNLYKMVRIINNKHKNMKTIPEFELNDFLSNGWEIVKLVIRIK